MTEILEANPHLALRPAARLIEGIIGRPVSHVTVGQWRQKLKAGRQALFTGQPMLSCPKSDISDRNGTHVT